MNTYGRLFRVTTFGESHGAALGCVVDGCPAGIAMGASQLAAQLARRRPGQSGITTSRSEPDEPEVLSGIFHGLTLGTPIAVIVRNRDAKSEDYSELEHRSRPGHADAAWRAKFGHVDHRGGGRSSGRETVGRVIGGWVAESMLAHYLPEMRIVAFVSKVGQIAMPAAAIGNPWTRRQVDAQACRCPDADCARSIEEMLAAAKSAGESYGGAIALRVSGLPVGLGEPVFLKLQSHLLHGLASIGSVCAAWWHERPFELPGSEFHSPGNTYGGVSGGISNGADLLLHLAAKPVATIGDAALRARHDPCALPRMVPVVESMAAIVLADLFLLFRAGGAA